MAHALGGQGRLNVMPLCHPVPVTVTSLLDREIYLYSDVDRLVGLRPGTARRWINGYRRGGKTYEPILRLHELDTEWVTWGEFVEARILAEYRDQKVPTARLRAAVEGLRQMFGLPYPLAHLRPYLAPAAHQLTIELQALDPADESGQMIIRTKQLLLAEPSQSIIESAKLANDERGEKFAAQIVPDLEFRGIVLNPDRYGGQPTFAERRVEVATIAGMVKAGDPPEEIAADYGLSLDQVREAIAYETKHQLLAS